MARITKDVLPTPVKLETGLVGFERRLNIGKKISEIILQKRGKKILAVYIWGAECG